MQIDYIYICLLIYMNYSCIDAGRDRQAVIDWQINKHIDREALTVNGKINLWVYGIRVDEFMKFRRT